MELRPAPRGFRTVRGRSLFKELLFRHGNPVYYVFDLVWLNGRDLRQRPLIERKRMLRRLIKPKVHILYAHHVKGRGRELFDMVRRLDLEGMVAKHKDGPYAPPTRWVKIKNRNYTQVEGRQELFERRSSPVPSNRETRER